jgi:hypothetical protein
LTIFLGMGVFALLAKLTKPVVVACLLLPGTIVSELAYIFGCLITGGEIRRSKIMPDSKASDGGQPTTEAQSKLGFFGPLIASTFAIVACGAAIVTVNHYMGKSVVHQFAIQSDGMLPPKGSFNEKAPSTAAAAVNYFWKLVHSQVDLLKRSTDVLSELKWKDWKVPLFVYLSLCLGVRLSVATRPVRPTLAAVVLIAGGIAITGALWKKFSDLMNDVWPLLSYVWGLLLLALVATLLLSGLAALFKALAGKSGGGGGGGGAKPAAKDK